MRILAVTLLTLASFGCDLDGRYALAALLLVAAVAELGQGLRVERARLRRDARTVSSR